MSDPYREWVWSPEAQNYYMYTRGQDQGKDEYVIVWAKLAGEQQSEDSTATKSSEGGSVVSRLTTFENALFDDPIVGRPERGNYELLDPSYIIQDRPRRFYTMGRVFQILWTEPLGSSVVPSTNENISTVLYGEQVFSQIRRFVVVKEDRGFCYACPISTYGGRGTGKPGLDPRTHSIIYTEGARPSYVQGEQQALNKNPIPVIPAPGTPILSVASRINFAIQHLIQHNVKAKDLGYIRLEYVHYLIQYARMEMDWSGSKEEETPVVENHQPRGSTVDEEGAEGGSVVGPENKGTVRVVHDDANRDFTSVGDSIAPVSTSQAQSVETAQPDRLDAAHKNDSSPSRKETNGRDPAQSDSVHHNGIGTDMASVCSIKSIGGLADNSPSFVQEFVDFLSRILIEKAGAYAWARYAISIHSTDVIEKNLGDLLKSYAIDLSHLAIDADAASEGIEQGMVQEVTPRASRLIRKHRLKIAQLINQKTLAAIDTDTSKSPRFREYIQFPLQEKIDVMNRPDRNFEENEESESDDDEESFDLNAAQETLVSGQPFRKLAVSMRRAFYRDETSKLSEIEECIRRKLVNATVNNADLPKPTVKPLHKASFSIEWDPIGFIESQYNRVETPIASMLVLSGSALYAHATTCADYLRMFWPNTCDIFLPVIQGAILDSKTTTKLDNGGYLNIEVQVADSNEPSERSVKIEIHGEEQLIIELCQQASWMAAVLRESPAGTTSVSYSCASLTSELFQQPGTTGFRISYKHQDLHPAEDACWFPFFENALIAYGFPIPERQAEVGLEISIDILAALTGVRHAVQHEGVVMLKGFSFMLVPSGKVHDIVQWHLIHGNDENKGLSSKEPLSYEQALTLCEHEPLLRGSDLDSLRKMRAIVGWCSSAQLLLGSDSIDYRRIGYTDAREARSRVRITGAALGFSQFATAQVNVAFGVKDGKFHWQGNNGPYIETVSRADDARVLLYDKAEKRAWLVPSSYAILHIAQARLRTGFLGRTENRTADQPAHPTDRENDLFHKETSQCTAEEVLLVNPERVLLDRDNYRFKDLVLDIWDVLDCLMAQKAPKGSDSGIDVRSMHDQLYGFEFNDVARKRFPIPLKSCPIERTSGGWTNLVQDIGALTILATGLEDLIKPSRDCSNLCHRWCSLPKGEDYLAVTIKLLQDLYYVAGCPLNCQYLTSSSRLQLERASSILFAPCKSTAEIPCSCDRLCQVVSKRSTGTEPIDLLAHEQGAVIVGSSGSILGKIRAKMNRRKESFYTQPNSHINLASTGTAPSLPQASTSGSDSSFQRSDESERATTMESSMTSIPDEHLPIAKRLSFTIQDGTPSVEIPHVGISNSLPVRTMISCASSEGLKNAIERSVQKGRKI